MLDKTTSNRSYRVGIDVGGTFTDLQILDETAGVLLEYKTSTVPSDPSVGVLTGLVEAAQRYGFTLDQVSMIIHGTTIATNAVLEHKLPPCALITTAGFEDILEIGRHSRKDIYGLYAEERRLLVPRDLRFGVRERVDATGAIEVELDEQQVARLADEITARGIKVIGVCLLNAFANPAHERRVAEILQSSNADLQVCISTDIAPEIREFERTSTAVLNASLMPIVKKYMDKLSGQLSGNGIDGRVLIVQSNGGVSSPAKAGLEPARLLLSGPCGGAIAAEHISSLIGEPNLIAVDMGGTSFDVSVVKDGRATRVMDGEVDGCPVRLPMAEIRTIGAGGGSIAWVDDSGRMRVGPQSAGAMPGPACYGRGGEVATVTDANLALGRISADSFMGGAMKLLRERSLDAIEQTLVKPLGLKPEQAAEGILAIADSHMASAIRISLFERGLDPEDFALISFGGAGGLHAAAVAAEAGVPRVIFPHNASTLSAYGMLWSDIMHDFARTKLARADAKAIADVNEIISELHAEGLRLLEEDRVPEKNRAVVASLDMRYKGQGYELQVPLDGFELDEESLERAIADFHDMHHQRFAHSDAADPVELVTVRVSARGLLPKPGLTQYTPSGGSAVQETRSVYIDGEWRELPVYDRAALEAGSEFTGPAIVSEPYTTIVIPSAWSVKVLPTGELVATNNS